MNERAVRALQFVTLQLVGAVAVIHFAVGTEQLASLVTNGLLGEYLTGVVLERPRPLLFVVSAVALLGGVVAAARGRIDRRTAYLLGVAAMGTYLVGWVAWHTVLDHGFALSGTGGVEGHSHDGLLGTLASHYVAPLLATVGAATTEGGSARTLLGIVSKTLELGALVGLLALLRVDPAVEGGGLGVGLSRPQSATDDAEER
ncbi:hypothetical protein [Halorarius halobius]|uniref:hypothetical protein n=1 Tax=Halorarius halobius TaxID=2962671 RepID=UPI0020CBF621|nr:hypothetical protein [Halorarius halobius]